MNKETFYKYFTRPLARFLDNINIPKKNKLKRLRAKIAMDNKVAYIEMTSKLLFEQDILEHEAQGMSPNPMLIPLLIAKHVCKAEEMFLEKKKNGDFDDLNILIN